MALLADSDTPGQRSLQALAARARVCLGHGASSVDNALSQTVPLVESLFEQLRRLSVLSAAEWARLEPDDVATWLTHGFWWRTAGVNNPEGYERHASAPAASCMPPPGGDDSNAWDDEDQDDDGGHLLPLHLWTPAQLAAAFRAWAARPRSGARLHWLLRPAAPAPLPAWRREQSSPASLVLASAEDVAAALAVPLDELLWLAPDHAAWREPGHGGHALPPSHYRYRLLPKPSGGLRLLEAPLARLTVAQRQVVRHLLTGIPVHEAAHGFVGGRSVDSHARVHTQQAVVIRFDLADFFTHIHATRVRALWRALGHARPAAELLTRLVTTRTPVGVRERLLDATSLAQDAIALRRALGARLARPHLPQGAPTSPALANLCAFGMDVRLNALAQRFGARYTRYADDMVFSGQATLRGQLVELKAWVTAIVEDEGFVLRADKTRVMPAHQRQTVTGLVVNQRLNYSRAQFDGLKARLHRLGQQPSVDPAERARLEGEIQWACRWLAPARCDKLWRLFSAIRFSASR